MSFYDESSGQVYTETVSAQVCSMIPAWSRHTNGRRINPSKYQKRWDGASSLQDMVMRSCLWHMNNMAPEALQWLSWHYAHRIYNQLKESDTLSFNAWSIFQRAFPEHIDRHHAFRYYESESAPASPVSLPSIVNRFSNLNVNMLSFLSLHNFHIDIDHLLSLKIHTLAALSIDPGQRGSCATMSSKNISDWGRAARETGAFNKLKVLILLGMSAALTSTILDCTSSFPALVLLGTSQPRPGKPKSHSTNRQLLSTHDMLWTEKFDKDWNHPHPRKIWEDPTITKAAQMQILYDIATKFIQDPPATADAQPRVSLTYSAHCRKICSNSAHWFLTQRHKLDALPPPKRPINAVSPPQSRPATDKKRKIRANKKLDITSFLDSLM